MRVRIGCNPIAWSNDDLPELGGHTPLETCLAEARAAGFAGIEQGRKFPAEPALLRAVLARHGLQFVSGWYGAELRKRSVGDEITAVRAHFELLRALGSRIMVFAEVSESVQARREVPLAERPRMSEDEWPGFLERLSRIGEWLAERGVRIAFYPHMGTVIETAEEIDRLLEGTPPSVGLLFDTGYLEFAGEDPARAAGRWAGRVNHVHVKDVRREALANARRQRLSFPDAVIEGVFTVPGDGMLDFGAALRPLAKAGYEGWLIVEAEQDPAKAHPFTYARKGCAHIRAVAERAGFEVS